ncbi:glutamyl-tRNA(Gln) amidotransferase subunit A [Streptosporangium violaceochromogenes]|nr:glutamyl-tRNA(Gln) amidotransferase subunit A [Streptosporangium violaceochromogenes]
MVAREGDPVRTCVERCGLEVPAGELAALRRDDELFRRGLAELDEVDLSQAAAVFDVMRPYRDGAGAATAPVTRHAERVEAARGAGGAPVTLTEAGEALAEGRYTSTELTERLLERIDRLDRHLGAFVAVDVAGAMRQAGEADREIGRGRRRGALHGVPIAIKDVIDVEGLPTVANSRLRLGRPPEPHDAVVVRRLREAGAVVLGKTTTYEFAAGLPDEDAGFPYPRHPWNDEHSPLGSSTGMSIAIVAGLAFGGLGTDTGGSVRAPAAATGHTGLKCTYGALSTRGVVPLSPSLDTVGPMARSARDCAHLLDAMSEAHGGRTGAVARLDATRGDLSGTRVGVPVPWFYDHPRCGAESLDATQRALDAMEHLGAVVDRVDLRGSGLAATCNHVIVVTEALARHRADLARHWALYGSHTRVTIARGALVPAPDLVRAQRFRSVYARWVGELLHRYDVLVTPTLATAAPPLRTLSAGERLEAPGFTSPWNLAGLPAVAIPAGFSASGLPLSVQIVGRPFAEGTVLAVADAYQRITDWHLRGPRLG